jgi:hypothetical protein
MPQYLVAIRVRLPRDEGGHEGKPRGKEGTESASEFGHGLPKTTVPSDTTHGK